MQAQIRTAGPQEEGDELLDAALCKAAELDVEQDESDSDLEPEVEEGTVSDEENTSSLSSEIHISGTDQGYSGWRSSIGATGPCRAGCACLRNWFAVIAQTTHSALRITRTRAISS